MKYSLFYCKLIHYREVKISLLDWIVPLMTSPPPANSSFAQSTKYVDCHPTDAQPIGYGHPNLLLYEQIKEHMYEAKSTNILNSPLYILLTFTPIIGFKKIISFSTTKSIYKTIAVVSVLAFFSFFLHAGFSNNFQEEEKYPFR